MENNRPKTRDVSERQIDLHSYPLVFSYEAKEREGNILNKFGKTA